MTANPAHRPPPAPEALERIRRIVGPRGWTDDAHEMEPYLVEPRGRYRGTAPMIVRPASTEEVSAVIAACAADGVGVVPQGGNTGLVGGSIPWENGNDIVLSLTRMNRVRAIDPDNDTITVEAGCVLADVQKEAEAVDRLYPLRIGSEGTCQVGGTLSTNAGGTAVLHYGNARDLVLGLEVVLPDGTLWDGLRGLRKDNTGYDLKQLFIGGEGTLGVITAAVLKLFPRPHAVHTAFAAVADPHAAIRLFRLARARLGEAVTACEILPRICIDFALRHLPGARDPLTGSHAWYVLIEVSAFAGSEIGADGLTDMLGEAAEAGIVEDATVAANAGQAEALWRIRDGQAEVQKHEGGSIKSDVSVPLSRVAEFIDDTTAACEAAIPGVRVVAFGHLGDGNIHFNLSQPVGADTEAYLARWEEIVRIIHDIAAGMNGSFSAEHGIGRMRRAELERYRSTVELGLMRKLKAALDPKGIMNPGKLLGG